jgi:16S rRNA processing protein RimM
MTTSSEASVAWTILAHLLRPQGRKGELLADLCTDFPERFSDRGPVFLAKPDFAGPATQARAIAVTNHWLPVGRNQGRVVLAFEGVASIDAARQLAGLDVLVPVEARVELEDDDAEYISDLIGCIVFDSLDRIGAVTGVQFPTSPDGSRRLDSAAPLLIVQADSGEEILIPYVQSFLVALRTAERRIDMRLPAGLVELNRAAS